MDISIIAQAKSQKQDRFITVLQILELLLFFFSCRYISYLIQILSICIYSHGVADISLDDNVGPFVQSSLVCWQRCVIFRCDDTSSFFALHRELSLSQSKCTVLKADYFHSQVNRFTQNKSLSAFDKDKPIIVQFIVVIK